MYTRQRKFLFIIGWGAIGGLLSLSLGASGALAATTVGSNVTTNGNLIVNGLLQFTNGAALGNILTSDAVGNATWAAETDPIYSGDPASGILAGDITDWDAAFTHVGNDVIETALDVSGAETDPAAGGINGIVKSNGAGAFSAVTDNSANWNTAFGWGNHSGLYTPIAHKTTEDAINGIVKVNGAGVYSAVTDSSANWNTAFTHVGTDVIETALDVNGAETDPAAVLKSTFVNSGDILYGTGAGTYTKLGIGAAGEVLTVTGGLPDWAAAGAGDITDVGDVTSGAAFNGTAGNNLYFEGTTADGFETDLTAADTTGSDKTITLPNATGIVLLDANIGSSVQAYDADLATLAGLSWTDGNFIVGNGATWVVESGSTARTSLGAAASGVNTDITSLTGLNTQNAIQVGPYGVGAGNTGEQRYLELVANGANYAAVKSPDALAANYTLTLPTTDGNASEFLQTDGNGVLSWTAAAGSGDITAVGDILSGAAFTATAGADGNSLYFEGTTSNGNEILLTGADPGADVTVTIPATAGTLLVDANIGSSVQAYDADLATLAGLSWTDGNFIVGNGATWVVESGATVRTSLGLGTGDSPSFTAITATGGTINTGDATHTGSVLIYDGSANKVTLTSPALGADYTLTLPTTDGNASEVLQTDGSGVLSWTAAGAGDITAVGDILTGAAFTATAGADGNSLYFEGTTGNANEVLLTAADPGADVTVTIPAVTGQILLSSATLTAGSVAFSGANGVIGQDNTNFFWDDNNNRLGILTNAPAYAIDVAGVIRTGYPGTDGQLRVYSEQGASDYEVIFNPNAAMTQNTTYTLPADDGAASQFLQTDGNGNLTWAGAGASSAADLQTAQSVDTAETYTNVAATEVTIASLTITPTTTTGDIQLRGALSMQSGNNVDQNLVVNLETTNNCSGTVLSTVTFAITSNASVDVGRVELQAVINDPGTSAQSYSLCASTATGDTDIKTYQMFATVIDNGN